MTEHSTLLADDQAAWTAAAATVLRKSGKLAADAPDSDAWSRLARRTVEGIPIPPLGTRTLAQACTTHNAAEAAPGSAPFLRGNRATGGWGVRALIADPDPAAANRSVTAALTGGVTSLWLRLGTGAIDPRDLQAVLAEIRLDATPIVLEVAASNAGRHNAGRDTAGPDTAGSDTAGPGEWQSVSTAADTLASLADGSAGESVLLHPDSCLGFDPIGSAARRVLGLRGTSHPGESREHSAGFEMADSDKAGPNTESFDASTVFDGLPEITAAAGRLGIRALVVDGTAVHDVGAGDALEIGYTLAVGAAYLRALTSAGTPIDTACRLIEFRYAVTDEQFVSIAKLRAARLAWHRVCELSGAAPAARAARQHAVTSRAMMTRYDRYVNMLRATIATFAAGVGGADAITTLPFDSAPGSADEFGQRMARNVSALLIGESHVGAIADPAGGAYAVEILTADLADAGWAEFGHIEAAGGVLAALADGAIDARIAATRLERHRRIARRTQPITGVSEFPDPSETLGVADQSGAADDSGTARYRWAEPFESLRDSPPPTPLLLVRVGTEAHASARILFTENLLAAGGIRMMHSAVDPSTEIEPTAERAGVNAVISAGVENNVSSAAAAVTAAVRDTGCRTVVFAGADADYGTTTGTAASNAIGEIATAARAAGASAVFLAGRPKRLLAEMPDGVIDGTVAVGDDALEFLRTVRATLGAV